MRVLFTFLLVAGAFFASLKMSNAEATKVQWAVYMQTPAAVSAIGAAVSLASPCSKKLVFEEKISKHTRTIAVHCPGESGYEVSVFVNFDVYGDQIIPKGYSLAG